MIESKGEFAIAIIGECRTSVRKIRVLWTIFLSALVIVLALAGL